MAALTKDRNTAIKSRGRTIPLKMAAATKIFNGSIVSVNAAGYAVPASDTAATIVIGRAEETVDNTGAAGDLSIKVTKGVFKWNTSGGFPATQADVGSNVVVLDDNSVQNVGGSLIDIVVGVMDELDDDDGGIWVATL